MRCNNTTGRQGGVMEGKGVGEAWLSRQSLHPSLLLMPTHYQGAWPSSCEQSLHDVVINALGYRAIPLVCSLSSLCQLGDGESCTCLKSHMKIYILETHIGWKVKILKESIQRNNKKKKKWDYRVQLKKSINNCRNSLWHRGGASSQPGCWDKLSLSAAVPPGELSWMFTLAQKQLGPGWSMLMVLN